MDLMRNIIVFMRYFIVLTRQWPSVIYHVSDKNLYILKIKIFSYVLKKFAIFQCLTVYKHKLCKPIFKMFKSLCV